MMKNILLGLLQLHCLDKVNSVLTISPAFGEVALGKQSQFRNRV